VGRVEGREDAMQDQEGGYESSSELYSDAMDENDADSRVRSAMLDKYSFLFLNKLLNNHRLKVLQWQPSWPYGEQGPQNMKLNMPSAAILMVIGILKPAFQISNPRAPAKIPHENRLQASGRCCRHNSLHIRCSRP